MIQDVNIPKLQKLRITEKVSALRKVKILDVGFCNLGVIF